MACPVAGVPHPALLVVHAAWVAVEAVEVELLLAGGRQVLGPPTAHQLLRRQLLLLLRAQLPLEGRPRRDAQRRQALGIPAASTVSKLCRQSQAVTGSSQPKALTMAQILIGCPDSSVKLFCQSHLFL